MHRDVGRSHGQHPVQGALEALQAVSGQPGDQVHVYQAAEASPGQFHGLLDLDGGMGPAHGAKDVVLHGLGIDGDAADAVSPQYPQLVCRDGVRPARLHGELPALFHGQTTLHRRQHPVQLRGSQGGGGAAPHVGGGDVQSVLPQQPPGQLDLPAQSVHIGLHQSQGPLHIGGDEGAVGAPGGAEGNADV